MEELINLIVEKRNLSDSTIKNYKSVLRRLQVLVGKKDVEPFLKSNEILLQKIKKGYKKPYQLNLINVMVVALDAYTDHIKDFDLENSLEKYKDYQIELKKELGGSMPLFSKVPVLFRFFLLLEIRIRIQNFGGTRSGSG